MSYHKYLYKSMKRNVLGVWSVMHACVYAKKTQQITQFGEQNRRVLLPYKHIHRVHTKMPWVNMVYPCYLLLILLPCHRYGYQLIPYICIYILCAQKHMCVHAFWISTPIDPPYALLCWAVLNNKCPHTLEHFIIDMPYFSISISLA